MPIPDQIVGVAGSLGVDPELALAIAQRESGFNQSARGSAGEIGIFQVKPTTAAEVGISLAQLQTVEGNILAGVRYLRNMLGMFGGDPFKATAAYNAGPDRVGDAIRQYGADWFNHIPGSTQDYVADVVQAAPTPAPEPSPFPSLPAPSYAGIVPTPSMEDFQPLAIGLALAGALLVTYSFVAGEGGYAWD